MATRKKGGLGTVADAPEKKDLLDSVFGGMEETPEKDTPPRPTGKSQDGERVAKYMKLDREIARKLKVFAAIHEKKEVQVIEEALCAFFERENG